VGIELTIVHFGIIIFLLLWNVHKYFRLPSQNIIEFQLWFVPNTIYWWISRNKLNHWISRNIYSNIPLWFQHYQLNIYTIFTYFIKIRIFLLLLLNPDFFHYIVWSFIEYFIRIFNISKKNLKIKVILLNS